MANDFAAGLAPPRAFLAPCLLLVLAESPGHGYELAERLKPLGFDWNGPARVYRALRSLEAAGLVKSDWVPTSGAVPRVYELTPDGQRALQCSAADMIELHGLVTQYLARFRKVAAAGRPAVPATKRPRPGGAPGASRRAR
jgi:PadR family transcriptional regulator, regulatory protein PadR